MSEVINGKYLYYSDKEGKNPGVCVEIDGNNTWFNFPPNMRAEFDAMKEKKNSEVEIESVDKFISKITITKEGVPTKKTFGGFQRKPDDPYNNTAFYNGMVIHAKERILEIAKKLEKPMTNDEWSMAIAEATKSLVNAIKKVQSFGEPKTQSSPNTTTPVREEVKNDASEEDLSGAI